MSAGAGGQLDAQPEYEPGRAQLRRRAPSHGYVVLTAAGSGDANNDGARSDCDVARGMAAWQR